MASGNGRAEWATDEGDEGADWSDDGEIAGEDGIRNEADPGDARYPYASATDPEAMLFAVVERLKKTGGRLHVARVEPKWAAGQLCRLEIPGDTVDVDELQRQYGGGLYQIRPKVYRPGKGFVWTTGLVTMRFGGPPLYNGQPLGPDGYRTMGGVPYVIDTTGRERRPALPVPQGTDPIGVLGQLFERLTARLDSIEQRIAAPDAPPDPLAQVRQTIAMVQGFGKLQRMIANGGELDDYDDDDDDDDDAGAASPSMESLAMKFIERELDGGNKQAAAAPAPAPAPASSAAPRLIRNASSAPPPPSSKPDPWSAQVPREPGREYEQPPEPFHPADPPPAVNPDEIDPDAVAAALEAMPTDRAVTLVQTAVERLATENPERLAAWVAKLRQDG